MAYESKHIFMQIYTQYQWKWRSKRRC